MSYPAWLFALSVVFILLERLLPRVPGQRILRRGIWNDVVYLVFNGNYLGLLVALVLSRLFEAIDPERAAFVAFMRDQPQWLQFVTLLFVIDFVQYLVHNLLHRVPVLWEFHKVHHSIEQLDWIGNWRFHWFEVFVYQFFLYPLAGVFGFSGPVMFWQGVLSTAAGHFAHANLRVHVGPLKYFFNSPEMHIWHHTHDDAGPVNRNFGVTLAVWDWLFGTAYLPAWDPKRLGFAGIEKFPGTLLGQMVFPFARMLRLSVLLLIAPAAFPLILSACAS